MGRNLSTVWGTEGEVGYMWRRRREVGDLGRRTRDGGFKYVGNESTQIVQLSLVW